MTPETRSLTTHYDTLASQTKESARRDIAKLRARLDDLEHSIGVNMQPATSVGGDLGLVGTAVDIQRHVDAWLSAAQSARVVRNVLED